MDGIHNLDYYILNDVLNVKFVLKIEKKNFFLQTIIFLTNFVKMVSQK